MVGIKLYMGLLMGAAALVAAAPAPMPTPAPKLGNTIEKRASCTFTDAVAASASKKSCATIVLNNIAVPSGTTLDMTSLNSGTHVSMKVTLRTMLELTFIGHIRGNNNFWL